MNIRDNADNRRGSYKWMKAVLENSQTVGAARMVLVVLAHHANHDGESWCGEKRIADEAGINRRTVARILKGVQESGEVEIHSRGMPVKTSGGMQFTNLYRLTDKLLGDGAVPLPGGMASRPKGRGVPPQRGWRTMHKGDGVVPHKQLLNNDSKQSGNQRQGVFRERI